MKIDVHDVIGTPTLVKVFDNLEFNVVIDCTHIK